MRPRRDVTLVIPNYNGRALLERNLPAVQRAMAAYPGASDLVVVDDASTEPGLEHVIAAYPWVHWRRHESNQGFSRAIATGVAVARSDYLVLLNSDVAPAEDFLQPLLAPLEDPDVFAVSPLIVDERGEPLRASWNRYRFAGGRLREIPWKLDEALRVAPPLPTLFASGGSMAVRRSYFLELGGFAELFRPFYVEDLDLGVRAWRHGWRVLFEPRSRVVHQQDGAIRSTVRRSRVKRVQRRNRLLFEWSHLPLPRLLFYRGPYYLKQLAGRALRGDRDYVAGFAAALARLGDARRHRRHVREISVIDFEGVLAKLGQACSL